MNITLVLRDAAIRRRAHCIIDSLPCDELHEMVIRPFHRNRSAEQNRYYWSIVTIIADSLGMSKEEMHEDLKERFLVPILTRDDPGYAEMMASVQAVRAAHMEGEAKTMKRQITRLTTTTSLTVKQFNEYLTDVQFFAGSMSIMLPAMEMDHL